MPMGSRPLTVRVLYDENQGKWVAGPSDETVQSRSTHRKKSRAKEVAKRLAKQEKGVLEVYTKDGRKQLTKDYGDLEYGGGKANSGNSGFSISDMLGF